MSFPIPPKDFALTSYSLGHYLSVAFDDSPMLSTLYNATAVMALASHSLFERQSTCAGLSYNHCPQSGLPSNFCCPEGQTCIPLAANTTLLCCPNTCADPRNCTTILPIQCDIQLQNVTAHPDNSLMTTALSMNLPTCGSGTCCPFGFTCNAIGDCVMNANQDVFNSS